MAYRNGTYIAFHAEGTTDPTASDIKYYNLMKAWTAKKDDEFAMVNSHDKTCAVRDTSLRQTLHRRLLERLGESKNFVLIIGKNTWLDTDWVPFEVSKAIDTYKLPIIAAYTGYNTILAPAQLRSLWPKALADRIDNGTAHVIHIPFKKEPLADAIGQFNLMNLPPTGLNYYTEETYRNWGFVIG